MALIQHPQAVRFCNEKARRLADLIETMDRTAQQLAIDIVTEFEANTGANANEDVVDDGADVDGRQQISKLDILALKFVCEQLTACMATDDRRAIVAKVSVNGVPLY